MSLLLIIAVLVIYVHGLRYVYCATRASIHLRYLGVRLKAGIG